MPLSCFKLTVNQGFLGRIALLYETSRCKFVCCSANQIIVRSNAKEFSEISEGDGGIGLKPEVTVVMRWGQITSFTAGGKNRDRVMNFCFTQILFIYIKPGMLPIIQFGGLIGQRL